MSVIDSMFYINKVILCPRSNDAHHIIEGLIAQKLPKNTFVVLCGLVDIVFAIGPKILGFKPGQG
jgi:hypothetical protein